MSGSEIEYLDEYKDLICSGNETNMRDDEDSSSIDQDIFESLFEDNSDDDNIASGKKSFTKMSREDRVSMDSLDMLVKDLGEQLNATNESRNQVKNCNVGHSKQSQLALLKETLSGGNQSISTKSQAAKPKIVVGSVKNDVRSLKQKSVATVRPTLQQQQLHQQNLPKRITLKNSNASSLLVPAGNESQTVVSSNTVVKTNCNNSKLQSVQTQLKSVPTKMKLPQQTIFRSEKVTSSEPIEDPLSLDDVADDIEYDSDSDSFTLSDISGDSYVSLSDLDDDTRNIIDLSNDEQTNLNELEKVRTSTPSPTVSEYINRHYIRDNKNDDILSMLSLSSESSSVSIINTTSLDDDKPSTSKQNDVLLSNRTITFINDWKCKNNVYSSTNKKNIEHMHDIGKKEISIKFTQSSDDSNKIILSTTEEKQPNAPINRNQKVLKNEGNVISSIQNLEDMETMLPVNNIANIPNNMDIVEQIETMNSCEAYDITMDEPIMEEIIGADDVQEGYRDMSEIILETLKDDITSCDIEENINTNDNCSYIGIKDNSGVVIENCVQKDNILLNDNNENCIKDSHYFDDIGDRKELNKPVIKERLLFSPASSTSEEHNNSDNDIEDVQENVKEKIFKKSQVCANLKEYEINDMVNEKTHKKAPIDTNIETSCSTIEKDYVDNVDYILLTADNQLNNIVSTTSEQLVAKNDHSEINLDNNKVIIDTTEDNKVKDLENLICDVNGLDSDDVIKQNIVKNDIADDAIDDNKYISNEKSIKSLKSYDPLTSQEQDNSHVDVEAEIDNIKKIVDGKFTKRIQIKYSNRKEFNPDKPNNNDKQNNMGDEAVNNTNAIEMDNNENADVEMEKCNKGSIKSIVNSTESKQGKPQKNTVKKNIRNIDKMQNQNNNKEMRNLSDKRKDLLIKDFDHKSITNPCKLLISNNNLNKSNENVNQIEKMNKVETNESQKYNSESIVKQNKSTEAQTIQSNRTEKVLTMDERLQIEKIDFKTNSNSSKVNTIIDDDNDNHTDNCHFNIESDIEIIGDKSKTNLNTAIAVSNSSSTTTTIIAKTIDQSLLAKQDSKGEQQQQTLQECINKNEMERKTIIKSSLSNTNLSERDKTLNSSGDGINNKLDDNTIKLQVKNMETLKTETVIIGNKKIIKKLIKKTIVIKKKKRKENVSNENLEKTVDDSNVKGQQLHEQNVSELNDRMPTSTTTTYVQEEGNSPMNLNNKADDNDDDCNNKPKKQQDEQYKFVDTNFDLDMRALPPSTSPEKLSNHILNEASKCKTIVALATTTTTTALENEPLCKENVNNTKRTALSPHKDTNVCDIQKLEIAIVSKLENEKSLCVNNDDANNKLTLVEESMQTDTDAVSNSVVSVDTIAPKQHNEIVNVTDYTNCTFKRLRENQKMKNDVERIKNQTTNKLIADKTKNYFKLKEKNIKLENVDNSNWNKNTKTSENEKKGNKIENQMENTPSIVNCNIIANDIEKILKSELFELSTPTKSHDKILPKHQIDNNGDTIKDKSLATSTRTDTSIVPADTAKKVKNDRVLKNIPTQMDEKIIPKHQELSSKIDKTDDIIKDKLLATSTGIDTCIVSTDMSKKQENNKLLRDTPTKMQLRYPITTRKYALTKDSKVAATFNLIKSNSKPFVRLKRLDLTKSIIHIDNEDIKININQFYLLNDIIQKENEKKFLDDDNLDNNNKKQFLDEQKQNRIDPKKTLCSKTDGITASNIKNLTAICSNTVNVVSEYEQSRSKKSKLHSPQIMLESPQMQSNSELNTTTIEEHNENRIKKQPRRKRHGHCHGVSDIYPHNTSQTTFLATTTTSATTTTNITLTPTTAAKNDLLSYDEMSDDSSLSDQTPIKSRKITIKDLLKKKDEKQEDEETNISSSKRAVKLKSKSKAEKFDVDLKKCDSKDGKKISTSIDEGITKHKEITNQKSLADCSSDKMGNKFEIDSRIKDRDISPIATKKQKLHPPEAVQHNKKEEPPETTPRRKNTPLTDCIRTTPVRVKTFDSSMNVYKISNPAQTDKRTLHDDKKRKDVDASCNELEESNLFMGTVLNLEELRQQENGKDSSISKVEHIKNSPIIADSMSKENTTSPIKSTITTTVFPPNKTATSNKIVKEKSKQNKIAETEIIATKLNKDSELESSSNKNYDSKKKSSRKYVSTKPELTVLSTGSSEVKKSLSAKHKTSKSSATSESPQTVFDEEPQAKKMRQIDNEPGTTDIKDLIKSPAIDNKSVETRKSIRSKVVKHESKESSSALNTKNDAKEKGSEKKSVSSQPLLLTSSTTLFEEKSNDPDNSTTVNEKKQETDVLCDITQNRKDNLKIQSTGQVLTFAEWLENQKTSVPTTSSISSYQYDSSKDDSKELKIDQLLNSIRDTIEKESQLTKSLNDNMTIDSNFEIGIIEGDQQENAKKRSGRKKSEKTSNSKLPTIALDNNDDGSDNISEIEQHNEFKMPIQKRTIANDNEFNTSLILSNIVNDSIPKMEGKRNVKPVSKVNKPSMLNEPKSNELNVNDQFKLRNCYVRLNRHFIQNYFKKLKDLKSKEKNRTLDGVLVANAQPIKKIETRRTAAISAAATTIISTSTTAVLKKDVGVESELSATTTSSQSRNLRKGTKSKAIDTNNICKEQQLQEHIDKNIENNTNKIAKSNNEDKTGKSTTIIHNNDIHTNNNNNSNNNKKTNILEDSATICEITTSSNEKTEVTTKINEIVNEEENRNNGILQIPSAVVGQSNILEVPIEKNQPPQTEVITQIAENSSTTISTPALKTKNKLLVNSKDNKALEPSPTNTPVSIPNSNMDTFLCKQNNIETINLKDNNGSILQQQLQLCNAIQENEQLCETIEQSSMDVDQHLEQQNLPNERGNLNSLSSEYVLIEPKVEIDERLPINMNVLENTQNSGSHSIRETSLSSNSFGLTPLALDSHGTRLYSFLHPAKYTSAHCAVPLDYCCPNLDGPMAAIDPTRIHAQVQAPVRDLPAYIVMRTELITRADLEANRGNIPISIRQKVEKLTSSANTSIRQNENVDVGMDLFSTTCPGLPPQKSNKQTNVSKMNKSSGSQPTSSIKDLQLIASNNSGINTSIGVPPPLTPFSTFMNSQQISNTIKPTSDAYQRNTLRSSWRRFDSTLKKHGQQMLNMSFIDRHRTIEAILTDSDITITTNEVEIAERVLDFYAFRLKTFLDKAKSLKSQNTSSPNINTALTPGSSTCIPTSSKDKDSEAGALKLRKSNMMKTSPATSTANNHGAKSEKATYSSTPKSQSRNTPIYDTEKNIIGYKLQLAKPNKEQQPSVTGVKQKQNASKVVSTKISQTISSTLDNKNNSIDILEATQRLKKSNTILRSVKVPTSNSSKSGKYSPKKSDTPTSPSINTTTTKTNVIMVSKNTSLTITQEDISCDDECILPDINHKPEIKHEKIDEDFIGGN